MIAGRWGIGSLSRRIHELAVTYNGFVGAGNMAEAIFRGLLKAMQYQRANCGIGPSSRPVIIPCESYGLRTTTNNVDAVKDAHVVVLAVKPKS